MNYPSYGGVTTSSEGLNKYLMRVFGVMFLGLLTTAAIAFGMFLGVAYSDAFRSFIAQYQGALFALMIVEVILVFYLSARIHKMNTGTARALFVLYSALNGVTIGLICLVYQAAVFKAFLVAAIVFGIMIAYGHFTKNDLSKFRSILMVGLFGLIALTILNLFMRSSGLDWVLCIAGLAIFLGLTAYDMQRIKSSYFASASGGEGTLSKAVTMSALALYLDFINIFIYLLRIFGRD